MTENIKNDCCAECSTPASGASDETVMECSNPCCKWCHLAIYQTKEGWEEKFDKKFDVFDTNKPIYFPKEEYPSSKRIVQHPENLKHFIRSEIQQTEQRVARTIKEKLESSAYEADTGTHTTYLTISLKDFEDIFKHQYLSNYKPINI